MTEIDASVEPESFKRQVSVRIRPGENRRIEGRVRDHLVPMDVSREMGGDDSAPTPGEYLTLSLGGCVLNLARLLAVQRQMTLTGLEVKVSGELDLTRAFGLPTPNRAGYSEIEVLVNFQADAPAEEKDALLEELVARCPVCDTIQTGTRVVFSRIES